MSDGESRQKRREGPGWFATLGGAAVLIVLGFGVGLVAGAAWDEPELVIDHFSGRTTAVPVGRPAEPLPETRRPPVPLGGDAEVPVRAVQPERPQVAAPSPRAGQHAIQVGAFGEREAANDLARELGEAGYKVYVIEDTGGSARFKVRVGPLAEREEAERVAARLKKEHRLPTWVLTRDPR